MWNDLKLSLRSHLRRPAFTAVVVISLALGIGGSAAIFSVFNAVLLRDLPYPDPDQIYMMRTVTPDGSPTGTVTPREVRPFWENPDHPTVEASAIAWSQEVQVVDAEGRTQPSHRYGVTEEFFDVFGPEMHLGRGFERGEQAGPIVISYALWRDHYASDPDIVGKGIGAEGGTRRVVGVTPEDFVFPEDPGYWYLMRLGPAYDRSRVYRAYARLQSGQTEEQFQAVLARLSADLGPDLSTGRPVQFVAQPFLDYVVGDLRSTVTILLGATAILLLIACINVANLLLSRAVASTREVALREALGAGRWRIVRRLLTESFVLAAIGGIVGCAVAAGGVSLILGVAPGDLPRVDSVPVDGHVLLFAVVVTVLTGLLIGLAPAWRLASSQLRTLINEAGRSGVGGRSRVFGSLVVVEIALAVLLVIGAGLLIRSYANLTATDPGFDAGRALTLFMNVSGRVDIAFEGMDADDRPIFSGTYYEPMADFFRELRRRLAGLAEVRSVADANSLPLAPRQYDGAMVFNLPDRPGGDTPDDASVAQTRSVGPDFFPTMGMRLLRGRGLLPTDRQDTPGVAVVNESFARRHFAGEDPLGQRIHFPENRYVPGSPGFQLGHLVVDDVQVVGVVEDAKYASLAEPAEPTIFVSTEQWINRRRHLVVRAEAGDPASLVPAIRREIEGMDPSLTAQFEVYPDIVRASMARERLGMTLLVVFGSVALLLAAVGVYGLMSYSVERRRAEMAVRAAIGASAGQVMGLILRQGVWHALLGIALGVAGAVALGRVIETQLYDLSAVDVPVFIVVPLTLLVVSCAACLIPARRASRVAPAELLRTE